MAKKETGPIRVGLVGLGRAGWGMHRPELNDQKDLFRVVAACDAIESRRTNAATEWGCKTYATIDELIADPDVELVDIAHRSCYHFADAMKALKAGKRVLVEKPMTLTHAEAAKLEVQSKKGKGKLYVRHNRRFDPDFLHVSEILKSGILGEPYSIKLSRVHYARRDDWQTIIKYGGGQLLNWGPHIIDHALRFIDSPIVHQWSELKKIAAVGDAEDYLRIILKGKNGRVAEVEISGGSALGSPAYLIWGTRGALTCDCNNITMRYLDPEKPLMKRKADPGTPGETFGTPDQLVWLDKTIPVAPAERPNIWRELYGAIRESKKFRVTLEQSAQVMQVISNAKKGTKFELKK